LTTETLPYIVLFVLYVSAVLNVSELEGAVLGFCRIEGPCTSYAIRQRLLASPNPHWSGSAGSIYPLIERLKNRGLLSSQPHFVGRREATQIFLTRAGVRALRMWLTRPEDPRVNGVPPDALRTRVRFLGTVSAIERQRFIASARAEVSTALSTIEADCKRARESGDTFAFLTARGALMAMQARAAWLEEAETVFLRPRR
jgi:DNA-binding PadR family transcriptional regulator